MNKPGNKHSGMELKSSKVKKLIELKRIKIELTHPMIAPLEIQ